MKKRGFVISLLTGITLLSTTLLGSANEDILLAQEPPAVLQEYSNDVFSDSPYTKKDVVINLAKVWASEELDIPLEEIFFDVNMYFWGDRPLWRVDLVDSNNNIIRWANADVNTGQFKEFTIIDPVTTSIVVNNMNVVLVDYTARAIEVGRHAAYWLQISSQVTPVVSQHLELEHLSLEEAGTMAVKNIYEKFGTNIDDSIFEMYLFYSSVTDSHYWSMSVFTDTNSQALGDLEFFVLLDATTGEINSLHQNTPESPFVF